ncbi:LytR/AlgR family response regulator transcription factor [Latilactobacillus sakei]|uniref:Response regulator n=1 Tax=Latilactobacillus sakei TaxID=1599 RepID=Q48867_LATSK|nr:response regulator transcription factor [Latilactobacillus sakei]BBE27173.1 two-component system response regulator [Latilactobacillus curvatus]PKX61030.1 DNA-binding response regulator [Latilactobacillus sakei]PKX70457.1 DNA-binding response regulator [Latilactobacillus sakei]PKX71107.1 DNA-binding response regulator [Latilactobacillus sakei]PKX77026.1 DNA-binding response regulator [Latilactobacillus sakei]
MTYPIILCEDQITQLNQLETIIQNYILFHTELFNVEIKTQSPMEVIEYLKKFNPKQGIYFLDIDLESSIDGIELAEQIRANDVQAKIIFVTTHDEMIPLTLQRRVEALGFVTKDQSLDDYRTEIVELLTLAQQRIDAFRESQERAFTFSIGSQVFSIDKREILFIESSNLPHRVILNTKNGHYEFYGNLNDLSEKYPYLFRINRNCLVNLKNIIEIDFKSREILFGSDLSRKFARGKSNQLKRAFSQ